MSLFISATNLTERRKEAKKKTENYRERIKKWLSIGNEDYLVHER